VSARIANAGGRFHEKILRVRVRCGGILLTHELLVKEISNAGNDSRRYLPPIPTIYG
jgi:hypothetical protein